MAPITQIRRSIERRELSRIVSAAIGDVTNTAAGTGGFFAISVANSVPVVESIYHFYIEN